jgi:hypothetical protein
MYLRISQTVSIYRSPITMGFWVTGRVFCTFYSCVMPIFFRNFFFITLNLSPYYF